MKLWLPTFAMLTLLAPSASFADIKELSQTELRSVVSNSDVISTTRLVDGVERFTGGDVVEVRAFLVDGSIAYRALVRQTNGQLGSIMVDGVTGHAVLPSSSVGQRVTDHARTPAAAAVAKGSNADSAGITAEDANVSDTRNGASAATSGRNEGTNRRGNNRRNGQDNSGNGGGSSAGNNGHGNNGGGNGRGNGGNRRGNGGNSGADRDGNGGNNNSGRNRRGNGRGNGRG